MPARLGPVTRREARARYSAALAAYRKGDAPHPDRWEAFYAAQQAAAQPQPVVRVEVPAPPRPEVPRPEPQPAPAPRGVATHDSRLVCVVSDVHIPNEHPTAWALFRAWHASVRPHETIVLGDGIDLAAASRYPLDGRDSPFLVDEFRAFAREMNALAAECGTLTIAAGNHEDRLSRALATASATALRGLAGLSFPEIAKANGLTAPVRWFRESLDEPGLQRGQFLLQHGDRQSGRFGGGVHLGAAAVAKSNGQSILRGHHHRAQLFARTAYGRTTVGLANPCLTRDHDYSGGQSADWQRGWTVLELAGPDYRTATPHVLLVLDGAVSWGGRTWRMSA